MSDKIEEQELYTMASRFMGLYGVGRKSPHLLWGCV
jgi:hypothetical protein